MLFRFWLITIQYRVILICASSIFGRRLHIKLWLLETLSLDVILSLSRYGSVNYRSFLPQFIRGFYSTIDWRLHICGFTYTYSWIHRCIWLQTLCIRGLFCSLQNCNCIGFAQYNARNCSLPDTTQKVNICLCSLCILSGPRFFIHALYYGLFHLVLVIEIWDDFSCYELDWQVFWYHTW